MNDIKPEVKKDPVTEALKKLRSGESLDFRVTEEGASVLKHWANKMKNEPSGDGFKFTATQKEGMYWIKNTDFGWFKTVKYTDHRGTVYDEARTNVVGHVFEHPVSSADDVVRIAAEWIQAREAELRKG